MKIISKKILKKTFISLGIKEGHDIFLHSSMKKFGYFINGPYDILHSLYEIINLKKGTLVIPTHTGQMTNPRFWKKKANTKVFKKNINEFDCKFTLPRNRGLISLIPLIDKRFNRSCHPLNSVAAIGKKSKFYTYKHPFQYPEGIGSPVWRLYKKKAFTLLFGVNLNSCSSIHLAEYLLNLDYLKKNNMSVFFKGTYRKIKKYPERSNKFNKIMRILKKKKLVKISKINNITIYYINIYLLVNLCLDILKNKNNYFVD